MSTRQFRFWETTLRTIVVHTVTYFSVGLLAFAVFDYSTRFAEPAFNSFLRQTDEPLVAAGPLFQPMLMPMLGLLTTQASST